MRRARRPEKIPRPVDVDLVHVEIPYRIQRGRIGIVTGSRPAQHEAVLERDGSAGEAAFREDFAVVGAAFELRAERHRKQNEGPSSDRFDHRYASLPDVCRRTPGKPFLWVGDII
jgi:hypothetical protein